MTLSTDNINNLGSIVSINLMIIVNRYLTQIATSTLSMIIHSETVYFIRLGETGRMMKSRSYSLDYFLIDFHPLTILIKVNINLLFFIINLIGRQDLVPISSATSIYDSGTSK